MNYNAKNLIVFHFPRYAGGKFVQNCIGLSNNVVFQKQSLAQAQIDGNFSFEDKKEYILTNLERENITGERGWQDLGLGCWELFLDGSWKAMGAVFHNQQHPAINNTVKFLSSEQNDRWMFCINWHADALPKILESEGVARLFFPNAKIITFKNNSKMSRYRCSFLINTDLLTTHQLDHWDEGVILEREADFTWNTEWLNDVNFTINGLHELYKLFNLDGWEQAEPFIKEYYYLWCKKNHLPIK